jgi:hypothetical protein
MTDANVNLSLTNLTQMDRFQSDTHRGPIVNQEQNADAVRHEAARRLMAPTEPDKVEGKKVDPEARREEERRKKERRGRRPDGAIPKAGPLLTGGQGRVIDYEA